jgi:hypothetical protein
MGLLDEIIKDVANEAKYALKDELRSEVRSETRQAVRGAVQGTKQGIGQAGQAVKDGISGQGAQQPNVMSAAPAPVEAAPAPAPAAAPVEAAPAAAPVVQTVAPTPVEAAPVATPAVAPSPAEAAPVATPAVAPAPVEAAPVEAAPAAQPAQPAATGSSENIGEALANATGQAAPAAAAFNNILNSDSVFGKLANAVVSAKMTDEEKAEMKEGLDALSDPEKVAEAQKALVENSDQIEAKLKEQGVDTEGLKNMIDQNS